MCMPSYIYSGSVSAQSCKETLPSYVFIQYNFWWYLRILQKNQQSPGAGSLWNLILDTHLVCRNQREGTLFYHPITGYFSHLLSDVKISQCFTVKGVGRRMGEASPSSASPYQIHPKSTAEDGGACSCCTCCYWWRWWISNWWRFDGFCTNNNWSEACWFPGP